MADIDKTKPGDSDLLSQYPPNERDSRAAIEAILAVDHEAGSDSADDGKHKLVQLLAQSTPGAGVAGQGHFYAKDTGSGIIELFFQDEDGNEAQLTDRGAVNHIESDTNMVFNQAAAPTGWTQDTTLNDRVLRVVDDTGTGGSDGGSWTISGVTVDGHTLTVSEMPSHNHGGSTGNAGSHTHSIDLYEGSSGSTNNRVQESQDNASDSNLDANTNAVGNHSHSISSQGGGSSHTHGLTSDGTWRPLHRDVIAAIKD